MRMSRHREHRQEVAENLRSDVIVKPWVVPGRQPCLGIFSTVSPEIPFYT